MTLALVLWTLLPGLLWAFWLYKRDVFEPEPLGMIARAFILGMLITLPAGFLNETLFHVLLDHTGPDSGMETAAIFSFGIVGPVEEGLKFLAVYLFFFRHKEFDEPIDGLIYAGTVALGFASAENLYYVSQYGSEVIPIRGLLAVPGHFLFAASYGYAMGMKKGLSSPNAASTVASTKRSEKDRTSIPHPNRGMSLGIGLLIAIIAHGAYNFSFFGGALVGRPAIAWGGVGCVMGLLIRQWGHYVRTLDSLSQHDQSGIRRGVI